MENVNLDILNNGIVLEIWWMMVGLMLMQLPRKKESSKANHTSSLKLGKRYIDVNWTLVFYLVKVVLQPSFPIENSLVIDNLCFCIQIRFFMNIQFTLHCKTIHLALCFCSYHCDKLRKTTLRLLNVIKSSPDWDEVAKNADQCDRDGGDALQVKLNQQPLAPSSFTHHWARYIDCCFSLRVSILKHFNFHIFYLVV